MKPARHAGADISGNAWNESGVCGYTSENGRPACPAAESAEDVDIPVRHPFQGARRSARWILPLGAVLLSLIVSLIVGSLTLRQPASTEITSHMQSSFSPPAGISSQATTRTSVISDPQWAKLLPELEKAAKANPQDRTVQQRLALAFFNLGRFEEAEAIYRRLLAKQDDAVLWNRLGNVLRNKGDLVGAEAAYRRSIEENPSLVAPYINLAELLWRQQREKEALDLLTKGKEKAPQSAKATFDKVRDALQQGQHG